MPTYEYRCAKCGDDLEVYQSFSAKALTKHAGCGGKLTRVYSPVGIVLKGSGFYKTDNRSSSGRAKAREDAGGSSSSDSKSSDSSGTTKSDAKVSSDSGSSSASGDSGKSKSSEKSNGSKSGDSKKSGEKKSPVKSA
jgi:putative FmdB family regulatory protein